MIKVSDMDQQRFGKRIAKSSVRTVPEADASLKQCEEAGIEMLIARVPTDQLAVAQALEARGGFITDVLIYYGRSLIHGRDLILQKAPSGDDLMVRPVRTDEALQVREMARLCFTNYYGHYHADPRLDRASADETYVDWAYQSCLDRAVADEVLVAESRGTLCAFATLRLNSESEAEGVLFGVAPHAQGKGTYRKLIQQSMIWAVHRDAKHIVYSTQINNLAVQKVWVKEGCSPERSYITLHCWFDR